MAMKLRLWKLYIQVQTLIQKEEGQDLIEYALVVALIAFAATAGMQSLANGINNAFTSIGSTLTGSVG
jgi:pilus assembly protein Flp/PilA